MRPLRVVIADGGLTSRSDLLQLVERAAFDVVGEALEWQQVSELVETRAADLVLVVGNADFARGAHQLNGKVASIIVAPDAASTKDYADCPSFAVFTPSIEAEVLAATAATAVARAMDLVAARRECEDLRDSLETRKVVERAKGVLMRRLGVDEQVAYRRMQKASQDENKKMREIAESILSAERLYGVDGGTPNPADAL